MPNDIMTRVQQAEQEAETIRAQAQAESREMIKAAEEAALAGKRDALAECRNRIHPMLEDAQAQIQAELAKEEQAAARERAARQQAAQGRIDQAATLIFERILSNGNR